MMNDCVNGDIRDALPELVNGTLPVDEVARVQEHVQECAACSAEVELLRTARRAMRVAPTMDTMRIAAAVQASTARGLAARRVPARAARIATVSLVILLAAVALWPMSDDPPGTREVQVAETAVRVTEPAVVAPGVKTRTVAPTQLALGGDISELADDQLLTLLAEVEAFEAIPDEEPAALAIEPVVPVIQEDL